MFRRVLTYVSTVFFVAGMLSLMEAPAQASTSSDSSARSAFVVVRIPSRSIKIGTDGSIQVSVRVRCSAGLNVFEFDATVRQGSALGATSVVEPNLTPCDGRVHTLRLSVTAAGGTFVAGPASLNVFVGAFDPAAGDIDVSTGASISLR